VFINERKRTHGSIIMNTATATSSFIKTDSIFRRKARAFLAVLTRSLELSGRAYLQGIPPL
jgi:hypothetical protein